MLSVEEKYYTMAKRNKVSITEVAKRLNCSRQNIYGRLKAWSAVEKEIARYAEAIGCEVEVVFKDRTTGEAL